jgi:TolB-like protein
MDQLFGRCYAFGPFRLDTPQRLLRRTDNGAGTVSLTPRVFDTLVVLVEKHGRVVSREELMRKVWHDSFVEEANLTVSISVLRKRLGTRPKGEPYIETVPKRGYCFVAPVQEIRADEDKSSQTAAADALEKTTYALAVMPFVNATIDPYAEYLSDGITESIINNLSQLPRLLVLASQTVFRYKGQRVDVGDVGRELNVQAVLTGRVLRFGKQLIVRTQLIKIGDNSQLWGEQYACLPADILVAQEEIAREISEKLRLKLTTAQSGQLSKLHRESSEA